MNCLWIFRTVLVLAVGAVPYREMEDGQDATKVLQADDARKHFLAMYEPELPFLVGHYVKNRQIKIVGTRFDRDGRESAKTELQLLSSDTCISAKSSVVSRPPKTPSSDALPSPSQFQNQSNAPERPLAEWLIFRPDGIFKIAEKTNGKEHVLVRLDAGGPIELARTESLVSSAFCPCARGRRFFSEHVRQPAFTVVDLEECEWQGRRLTRLRLSEKTLSGVTHKYAMYFDPQNHWIWHGTEIYWGDAAVVSVDHMQYGAPVAGVSPPVGLDSYQVFPESPNEPRKNLARYEYVEFNEAHPDASAFTLTQFGLAEPKAQEEDSGLSRHIFLIIGGLMLGATSLAIYCIVRYRQGAKAT